MSYPFCGPLLRKPNPSLERVPVSKCKLFMHPRKKAISNSKIYYSRSRYFIVKNHKSLAYSFFPPRKWKLHVVAVVLRRRRILIGIWYLFVSLRVKKLVLYILNVIS